MMRRKKTEAKPETPKTQPTPQASAVKASVKNMGNGELQLTSGTLSFLLKKGKDVAIKIPVEFIEEKRQDGNQLVIVHSGITERFTLQNADAPKALIAMLTAAQAAQPTPAEEPLQPQPESQEAPAQEPVEQPTPQPEQPSPETPAPASEPEPQPEPEALQIQQVTEAPANEPEETIEQKPFEQEEPQPETEETQPQVPPEPQAPLEPAPAPEMVLPSEVAEEPEEVAEQKPLEPLAPEEAKPEESQTQVTVEAEAPLAPEPTAEQPAVPVQPEEATPETSAQPEPAPEEKPAAPATQPTPQTPPVTSVVKASVKNMGSGELELAGGNLTFSVKKGLFGKQKRVAVKIPLEFIEDKRQEGSQLVIVHSSITDRFTLHNADASKAMIEMLTAAQNAHQSQPTQPQPETELAPTEQPPQPTPETKAELEKETAKPEAAPRPAVTVPLPDVPDYGFPEPPTMPEPEPYPKNVVAEFNIVADIADPLFDLIRGLQGKVNWNRAEENLAQAKTKSVALMDQTQGEVTLNFSKLAQAVKAHVPGEAGAEAFTLLKALQTYFGTLAKKAEAPGKGYPNYNSLQTALKAYYTLNDIAFGAELRDEEVVKEGFEFAKMVEQLSQDTYSTADTQPLKEAVSRLAREGATDLALSECRHRFREQFQDQIEGFRHYTRLLKAELSTEA